MSSVTTPPRIETERLVLREWKSTDLDAFAAMSADPEVMRYLWGAHGRAESWRRVALHAGHWALRGYGNWVVEQRADKTLLGRVGLWNPEGWPGLEIGWALAREAWGHGYATEAARAAIDWAWNVLEAPRLISIIDPENHASARVAERLELRRLRQATLHNPGPLDGLTVDIYGMERPGSLGRPPTA